MTERRVQYCKVDHDTTPWASEAPSFMAQVADIASLEEAVRQRVGPKYTEFLLRDTENFWVAWSDISELPQNCTLCVKAVKTVQQEPVPNQMHLAIQGSMNATQRRHLLISNYSQDFRFHDCTGAIKRVSDLPLPSASGHIAGLGSYFGLEGFDAVVRQAYKSLAYMHDTFADTPEFSRSMQLLRLVAAPGMGKSTALHEMWTPLFRMAEVSGSKDPSVPNPFERRIQSSMDPSAQMVFVMDLATNDMKNLTDYEKMTGVEDDSVLALRMLYSSVTSDSHYSTFLNKMDPHLRSQIQPLDVLFFWQAAGRIAPGTHWMAIFAVDEVGAAAPVSTPTQPSWISRALSYFVMLRKEAAELEGRGELMCMPVAITASTRASASSLHNTASGNSKVKDIHLRPLTKRQMHALVLSLVRRSSLASALPATLPDELMLLLQLTGGNPRMLSHTLCLTSGSTRAEDDVFLLGDSNWLEGEFILVQIVDKLCYKMSKTTWRKYLGQDDLGQDDFRANLLNQLVAHCVCCVRIQRNQSVPGSEAAQGVVTWQDLENDGLAYIGTPGEGLQPYDSGDSSSSNPTSLSSQADAEWYPEAGPEGGDINPDSQAHLVTMPPVLLLTAYRYMQGLKRELVWVPLLNQMTDQWRDRELTDVSILVARLLFWRIVFHRSVISLKQLLGGMDVGEHNFDLCVPKTHFHVFDVKTHAELTDQAQLAQMAANMDRRWAYQGPGNRGPDSWIILQPNGNKQATSGIVVLVVQSKKRSSEESLQSQQLGDEAGKMLRIPGTESLLLYVSDQHRPCQGVATSSFDVPKNTVLVDAKWHSNYYGHKIKLLKKALASPHGVKRPRDE